MLRASNIKMLDIKFIRKNPDVVKDACAKKNADCDIDKLLDIDQKKLKIQQELEAKNLNLKPERN